MAVSLKDFLKGTPVGYNGMDGDVIAAKFVPDQGIYLRGKKKEEWADVFTPDAAARFYYNSLKVEMQMSTDDLEIPKFLKRKVLPDWEKRRVELTSAQRDWKALEGDAKRRDFNQPKGMSDEEWQSRQVKKEAEKKEKREQRFKELKENKLPKISPRAGLIDAATLGKKHGIEGKDVRVILRNAKYPKPGVGWAFTEKEATEVERLIVKALKEEQVTQKTQTPQKKEDDTKKAPVTKKKK